MGGSILLLFFTADTRIYKIVGDYACVDGGETCFVEPLYVDGAMVTPATVCYLINKDRLSNDPYLTVPNN